MFFGYKYHAANVLTDLGVLPLAVIVAPANVSDQEVAPWLMKEACRRHETMFGFRPGYYLEDAGYDSTKLYNIALELKGQAIINLNKRGQKAPPNGFTRKGNSPLCRGPSHDILGRRPKAPNHKIPLPEGSGPGG